MVLNKLKPGIKVYDVKRATGLHFNMSKWSTWPVFIKEIDIENEMVFASWNGNPERWYNKHTWSKWRLKAPTE